MQKENPNIDELHQKAMQLADEAFYAKKENDLENVQSKYLAAFEYEKTAAMLLSMIMSKSRLVQFYSEVQPAYC